MSTDTMLGDKKRGHEIDWKRVADSYRDDMCKLKTKLDERTAWLRKEWQNGGNYEHLHAREDECGYIASLIGTLLDVYHVEEAEFWKGED